MKNKRGQHARGKKVTGVLYSPVQPGSLLVTSNDSRVRTEILSFFFGSNYYYYFSNNTDQYLPSPIYTYADSVV